MKLILVRHGMTDWNAAGRFQGRSDVPLNEIGVRQVAALAHRLAAPDSSGGPNSRDPGFRTTNFGTSIAAVYTSNLGRAWETARQIVSALPGLDRGIFPAAEPRLQEISFGEWEGLTYREIQAQDPDRLAAWQANWLKVAPPGGETLGELADRVRPVLQLLRTAHPDATVLVVGHGGPLQVLLCLALGLPPQAFWQFSLSPASLTEIAIYSEGAILNSLNDVCHLKEAPAWAA